MQTRSRRYLPLVAPWRKHYELVTLTPSLRPVDRGPNLKDSWGSRGADRDREARGVGVGDVVAIMPHSVVCGFSGAAEVAGSVEFADHIPSSRPPSNADGTKVIGWSNSLRLTAPDGIGLFCREQLTRAAKLRRLPAAEAVDAIRTGVDRGGRRAADVDSRLLLAVDLSPGLSAAQRIGTTL